MWKLLRNVALGLILLAGVLKLLAWYEVGQDAQRLVGALPPHIQVHYDTLSAGLDGSVSLSGVTATIKRGSAQDVYRADSLVLETPNIFWLLKHALLADDSLPSHFGISAQGLKLPAMPWLNTRWFNPATFVPFEAAGCGTDAFTPTDYSKMGVTVGEAREHLDYRYDPDSKLLILTLALSAPASANLTLAAEFHPFDPQTPAALEKLHVGQISLDYMDNGFLQRRNQYCAQRVKLGAQQFTDQHVAAAQALLAQHQIQASADLVKLYRRLVEKGGQASILSLPSSSFVAGAWFGSTPEDLLRQLNVTARYGDAPPVMFRLSFPPPPEVEPVAVAETPAPPLATPAIPPGPGMPSPTPAPPVATKPPPALTSAAAAPAVAPAPTSLPVQTIASATTPAKVESAPSPAAPVKAAEVGLPNLDREVARLASPPKPAASVPPMAAPKPTGLPSTELLSTESAPEPGSTEALIWKPTLQRLEPPAPEHPNYDVIEYARLKDEQGRRVRLLTAGGKRVEGYVLGVDEAGVALRINGSDVGGDVRYVIPKARIQQIQLLHRALPPA